MTGVKLVATENLVDNYGNHDHLYRQEIEAVIKNGDWKGQTVSITNEFSNSGAYETEYHVGNEVFVFVKQSAHEETLTGTIQSVNMPYFQYSMSKLYEVKCLTNYLAGLVA